VKKDKNFISIQRKAKKEKTNLVMNPSELLN